MSRTVTPRDLTLRVLISVVGCLAFTISSPGCSRGKEKAEAPNAPPALQKNANLFAFDYQLTTELLLAKADPVTGDRWTAHLSRSKLPSGKLSDEWRVTSVGGEHQAFADQKADGYFVLHLLDTLRSLRAERPEVPGSHESLGLAPPRYAMQWKTSDGKGFELRLGLPTELADKGQGVYAWIPGQTAMVAEGATLQMLTYVSSIESLRLKTWSGIVADDIDEIEVGTGAGAMTYAQREGADWTDRKHKSLRGDWSEWLKKLTHERVLAFVDDPARIKTLRARIAQDPSRKRVSLKNRQGHGVELSLARVDGKWFGLSSARPDGVFEVYPDSSRALVAPK